MLSCRLGSRVFGKGNGIFDKVLSNRSPTDVMKDFVDCVVLWNCAIAQCKLCTLPKLHHLATLCNNM